MFVVQTHDERSLSSRLVLCLRAEGESLHVWVEEDVERFAGSAVDLLVSGGSTEPGETVSRLAGLGLGQTTPAVWVLLGLHVLLRFGAWREPEAQCFGGSRERLRECHNWRSRFRQMHRLERPAHEFDGWLKVILLLIMMITAEAGINAYLFSQGNEFGLLGGLLAAVIVSLVNVGLSTLFGYVARYIHRRNWLLKLFGLTVIIGWMAFAFAINFGVAHFRDGLESGVAWRMAAEAAVPSLLASPLALASIESWLLVGIGALISILSFRKGWHSDDPYPGYGRVERALTTARARYVDELGNALDNLAERRDEAIEELQDASEQVRQGISEAVDALFGQSALSSHLRSFLDQCDVKVAHLLAVYRDANRAARTTPAPKSFDKGYKFPPFKPQAVDESRRDTAKEEAARVTATVDAAVRNIFEQFEVARQEFDVTRVVQDEHAEVAKAV